MSDTWLFETFIGGVPIPKGSMSPVITGHGQCPRCGGKFGAKAQLLQGGDAAYRQRLSSWRTALSVLLRAEWNRGRHHLLGVARGSYKWPIRAQMIFYLSRPKSAPSYVKQPTVIPDVDKLARVVMDELTGIVAKDDAQIVDMHAVKMYANDATGLPAGVVVRIGQGWVDGA